MEVNIAATCWREPGASPSPGRPARPDAGERNSGGRPASGAMEHATARARAAGDAHENPARTPSCHTANESHDGRLGWDTTAVAPSRIGR